MFKSSQIISIIKRAAVTLILTCFFVASSPVLSKTIHFVNANGYTLDSDGNLLQFTNMLVEDGVITAIGTKLDNPEQKDIEIKDLANKTILPGLIDSHGHILRLGATLQEVDLRGSSSEQEAANRVLEFVSGKGMGKKDETNTWIRGDGWNQELWANRQFPTKASLDKLLSNNPVVLNRVDGHAIWVNSKALELAGVTKDSVSPAGGEIVKDADGEPTGLLIDNAEFLVTDIIPKASENELERQLSLASQHLLSLGVTSAHDAGISKQVRDFFISKAENNELKFRIYAMLAATDPNIIAMLKDGHYMDEQQFLSIRSVKAYGDGALGSRGAALIEPYSDDPDNYGLLVTAEERLPSLFNNIIGANFQLNFHAIGDRANRLALNQFAKTFELFPENNQRHRVEHAQVVAVEDIPLFKKYGIIPAMQPTHATSDMNMAEDRVGKARLKGAYAWQTFLKQGSRIAFGSDFPVELANPFHGLHAAITRQDANQQPKDGWISSESVTRIQALKGFTLDAAYSGYQEEFIGSLEVGKKADFIVIDKDYFKVDESEIRDIEVLATYIDAEPVFVK